MRVFVILCLASFAFAVHPGYNYRRSGVVPVPSPVQAPPVFGSAQFMSQPSHFGTQRVVGFGSPSLASGLTSNTYSNGVGHYAQVPQYAPQYTGLGSASLGSAYTSGNALNAGTHYANHNQYYNTGSQFNNGLGLSVGSASNAAANTQAFAHGGHHGVLVTKHIHLFAAPEENEVTGVTREVHGGPAHKHYKIIFIKAPTQSSRAAALSVAQAVNQEKTIIYVLSKKPDVGEIQTAINVAQPHINKPEVYFIKYRTHEEAAHAQQKIKEQYDALGGAPTQVTNEGVAPVGSVIGALGTSSSSASNGAFQSATNGYLPPKH